MPIATIFVQWSTSIARCKAQELNFALNMANIHWSWCIHRTETHNFRLCKSSNSSDQSEVWQISFSKTSEQKAGRNQTVILKPKQQGQLIHCDNQENLLERQSAGGAVHKLLPTCPRATCSAGAHYSARDCPVKNLHGSFKHRLVGLDLLIFIGLSKKCNPSGEQRRTSVPTEVQ